MSRKVVRGNAYRLLIRKKVLMNIADMCTSVRPKGVGVTKPPIPMVFPSGNHSYKTASPLLSFHASYFPVTGAYGVQLIKHTLHHEANNVKRNDIRRRRIRIYSIEKKTMQL